MLSGDEFYPDGVMCACDDCECHDRAERYYEADPVEDLPGGPLCWNCAIGQHHEHDPLWCAP